MKCRVVDVVTSKRVVDDIVNAMQDKTLWTSFRRVVEIVRG